MFKVSKGIMPNYLSNLFMRTDQVHETRHAKFSYHLPKPNTNSINKLFGYRGAVVCNNLTSEIQNSSSIGKFKNCIKDHNFYNN